MDRFAARVANLLVGNDEKEPVIEMHFPAAQIEFQEDCRFALAGADFAATLNGVPANNWSVHLARSKDVLQCKKKVSGNRAYIAIDGGIKPHRAADGYATVRLSKGSVIKGGDRSFNDLRRPDLFFVSKSILPPYSPFPTVRIVPGGEFHLLSDSSKTALMSESFALSNESNRMGYRLLGPELAVDDGTELASAAVAFGTIQLLPDGQLIILMADHQTSGGYPRIANVISTDLPLLGQLGPADKVSFLLSSIEEAEQAAMRIESDLKKLRTGIKFGRYW